MELRSDKLFRSVAGLLMDDIEKERNVRAGSSDCQPQRPALTLLMVCVFLVVIVALASVLNILLARALARQGEAAVRIAMGGSLSRIALQHCAEAVVLEGRKLVSGAK